MFCRSLIDWSTTVDFTWYDRRRRKSRTPQDRCPQSAPWPQERPKMLTRLGLWTDPTIPMLFFNGSHASQIYPTTPPPGQGLLRFAKSTLARSHGTTLRDVEIIDSRCRGKRMKDGTSRWIGLDRARHDTRVLGSSIHPASPPLPAPALATILCAFAFTMEESPN